MLLLSQTLQIIFFILLPSFLVVLLKKLSFLHRQTKNTIKLPPPGPWKLPFLGSIHQLLTREPTHHRFHRLSKQYGDLFGIKLGSVDFVVASSTRSVRAVLSTHDHAFASRPTFLAVEIIGYNSCGIGFSPYGQYWRQLRKICAQELLSSKKVKSFGFIRYEEGKKLVEKIGLAASTSAPVNLTEIFMTAINRQITRAAFGKECASRGRFLTAMKETLKLLPMLRVADLFPSVSFLISYLDGSIFRMRRLRLEMDIVLDEIIKEHLMKETGGEMEEDLVDVLLRIQRKGELQIPLTMDNVKAVILDMLVAATETTSNTMCWVMSELMRHPDIMRKTQLEIRKVLRGKSRLEDNDIRDLHYLRLVIKETLRMHPPLPLLLPRTCSEATELLGFQIPAKARVVVNAWAIGRNPMIWKDPESFWPERFEENMHDFKGNNYDYIPFGSGRRVCPGITFAMAGMELFLGILLHYFDWKIPGDTGLEELDMEEEFDGTARRKKDLCLIAVSREIGLND